MSSFVVGMRFSALYRSDATRAIRQLDGSEAAVPIIAVTADAILEHRDDYMAAGMDAFITKPIDVTELLNTINAVLGEDVHLGG